MGLVQQDVVRKVMNVLSLIKEFLPRFQKVENFSFEEPSKITEALKVKDPTTEKYRLLTYMFNTRLFREICGAISNCCQCLSNLMSDRVANTNCIPLIQLLAYKEG